MRHHINILGGYCVGCGELISKDEMVRVEEIDPLMTKIKGSTQYYYLTKTPCCKTDVIGFIDTLWDDYEGREIDGLRISGGKDLGKVVKLCVAIGKSPYAIRMGSGGYYIDIKAKRFLSKVRQIFGGLLK